MADFIKFNDFVEQLGKGVHQLHAEGHTLKVYLTNNLPNVATQSVKANLAGITEQNGYAPADIQNDYTETGGVGTLTGVEVEWTALTGGFGPFRYVVLYNDTPTTPEDPLIAYWDYGSSISCGTEEKFKVRFDNSVVLTIT